MRIIHFSIFIFVIASSCYAQSKMSLEQCDSLFIRNNLQLLAEQYHIEAAQAAIIQAGIWDQPYFTFELNALAPDKGAFFNVGAKGQKTFAIQQLIYLGGKKQREVNAAKSDKHLAELQFQDLLRKLKFELRQNFYELYFNQLKAKSITSRLANLDTLISAYASAEQKGIMPLKDVVRLQSLALSFKNELVGIQSDILSFQQNLQLLTGMDQVVDPLISEQEINSKLHQVVVLSDSMLEAKAWRNNPDYLTALELSQNTGLQLQWQKSLNIPDITVGASYDQSGGAFSNQLNLTFGIPLPLWKRNKGNIQMYEAMLKQSQINAEQKKAELRAMLQNAKQSLLFLQKQYSDAAGIFKNFETVYAGVLQNFQRRNISLIEFTDFMESYNESNLFFNEIKKQIMVAGENLNTLVNEKIY